MRAVPGSGKSTLAKHLINQAKASGHSAEICSADEFFYNLGGGTYAFDPTKIADAHKYCFRKFIQAINQEINLIIVDNTNLAAWEISPYKMYAEAHDYDFEINEVVSDPELSFKRQHHGVPEHVHKMMSSGFEKEFIPPWWKKKRMISETDEMGEPLFQDEQIKKEMYDKSFKHLKNLSAIYLKHSQKL